MSKEDIYKDVLALIEKIRRGESPPNISSAQRVKLISKGNELFNKGSIELAGKVFRTVNYKDGLIRVGNYYLEKKAYFKALEFYTLAGFEKGKYSVYIAMGMVPSQLDYHDDKQKLAIDKEAARKIAMAIRTLLDADKYADEMKDIDKSFE